MHQVSDITGPHRKHSGALRSPVKYLGSAGAQSDRRLLIFNPQHHRNKQQLCQQARQISLTVIRRFTVSSLSYTLWDRTKLIFFRLFFQSEYNFHAEIILGLGRGGGGGGLPSPLPPARRPQSIIVPPSQTPSLALKLSHSTAHIAVPHKAEAELYCSAQLETTSHTSTSACESVCFPLIVQSAQEK